MGHVITVNPATLKAKEDELKGYNNNLKRQIETLSSQGQALCSMWEGEAKTEFQNAFQKDITQMNNFYNAIEKYVAVLQEMRMAYENAEKKSRTIASQRKYK